jgi:hypothetical protein
MVAPSRAGRRAGGGRNKTQAPATYPRGRSLISHGDVRERVRFNSDWAGYDPQFGHQDSFDTVTRPGGMDSMPDAADIGLGPYSAVILSQDD